MNEMTNDRGCIDNQSNDPIHYGTKTHVELNIPNSETDLPINNSLAEIVDRNLNNELKNPSTTGN